MDSESDVRREISVRSWINLRQPSPGPDFSTWKEFERVLPHALVYEDIGPKTFWRRIMPIIALD
jgi:hypothetical protein